MLEQLKRALTPELIDYTTSLIRAAYKEGASDFADRVGSNFTGAILRDLWVDRNTSTRIAVEYLEGGSNLALDYVLTQGASKFFYKQNVYRDGGTISINLTNGARSFTFLIDNRINTKTRGKVFFAEGVVYLDAADEVPFSYITVVKNFLKDLVTLETSGLDKFLLED